MSSENKYLDPPIDEEIESINTESEINFDYSMLLRSNEVKKILPELSEVNPYIRCYFHACLIVLYMQKEGFYLKTWEDYINRVFPDFKEYLNSELNKKYAGLKKGSDGKILEVCILHIVNELFNINNVIALQSNNNSDPDKLYDEFKEEQLPEEAANKILEKLKITVKVRGKEPKKVWGDNDIIVVGYPNKKKSAAEAICIISSKTSLRERVYQTIFWATHSRLEGIAKHVFLTIDRGTSSGNTEMGAGTKKRSVVESALDRVYVLRKEVEKSYVVKKLDYLKLDLIRWKEECFGE